MNRVGQVFEHRWNDGEIVLIVSGEEYPLQPDVVTTRWRYVVLSSGRVSDTFESHLNDGFLYVRLT